MKQYLLLYSVLMVVLLPCVLINILSIEKENNNEMIYNARENEYHTIEVLDGEHVRKMKLDEYIVGVVLGEIPDNFEMNAIKAQAVAARTYTLRRVNLDLKHDNADVCTNHACCQAFSDPSTCKNQEYLQKVWDAVRETSGQVLLYNDLPIEATYFSCSGGKTEDAVAVWGRDVPYLRSVESPGEEAAAYYEYTFEYSRKEFLALLGLPDHLLLYNDSVELIYTNGGGVDRMIIGGEEFVGKQLREILNLPSTAFSLEFKQDKVIITTRGNGHRVGMSQYGAEAMAVSGSTYYEILMHYYPGTELVTLSKNQMQAVFDKV